MGAGNETTRLADADRDLNEHFTASAGAKGQRYERAPSGGETCIEEIITSPWRQRELSKYRAIEIVLGGITTDARRTIQLVYGAGAGVLAENTGTPIGLLEGAKGVADPLGRLRSALAPDWGHGSFVRLALGQDRALRAFAKRHPGMSPAGDRVLDFLMVEAGRGHLASDFFAALRAECRAQTNAALRAFVVAFDAQLAAAKVARTKAADDERRRDERDRVASTLKVRAARISGKIPACLRMTDEQRERYRAAAFAVLGQPAEAES
jgi:hypothetical protein